MIDAALAQQRESLAQRLDRRHDHEIARDLEQVRLLRPVADDLDAAPHRAQQRLQRFERVRRARRDDEQLALRRDIRPAEHRRGDIAQSARRMRRRHRPRHVERYRCHVAVKEAGGRIVQRRAVEPQLMQRRVVGEHGEQHIAPQRIGGRARGLRALRDKRRHWLWRSIPHRQIMPRAQQAAGDPGAHRAQSDETDLHGLAPADSGCSGSVSWNRVRSTTRRPCSLVEITSMNLWPHTMWSTE